MDYKGEWGEGALDTPGPLNGTSGGGGFDPSLAVRRVAPTTQSISWLDSSLGRVPA
jgi:hypothetical protein